MLHRWLCAFALLLVGCGEDSSVVVSGGTDADQLARGASEDAESSDGDASDAPAPDSEQGDAIEPKPDAQSTNPCETGSVRGVICNPGELPEQSCTQLSLDATCGGETTALSSPLPEGGVFLFEEVPSAVQTLQIDV